MSRCTKILLSRYHNRRAARMSLGDIRVVVQTLTGGAFHLEIHPSEKIAVVKETLCHIQGTPVCASASSF